MKPKIAPRHNQQLPLDETKDRAAPQSTVTVIGGGRMSELPSIYVTYEKAGQMLSCGKRTIGRKVKAGELEARGDGKGKRVLTESVLRHPDYQRPS